MMVHESRVVDDASVRWIENHWSASPSADGQPLSFEFANIPFDYAVSHRPGTRFGPGAIVKALNGYSLYCVDKRINLEGTHFHHRGDVDVVHSLEESYRNIQRFTADLPPHVHPVFFGGDHSITDPLVRGMKERLGGRSFGLIIFDTHFDSRKPVRGKEHSGHWIYTLRDVIDYGVVVQLGLSAPIYSEQYMRTAEEQGILVRTPYEIRRQGWRETLLEAMEHALAGTDGIYISVDIDSIDQAFAPGTSVPNPCGFLAYEVVDAIFEISAAAPVFGLDITEVSPPLDHLDATAHLAAQIALNHVAGVVCRTALTGRRGL
ncbi:MAG: agmatinase [Acidobacteriota bacterium]|jgi:agmatinase|nr:agmatinase [Acidobacteriota bacterium]